MTINHLNTTALHSINNWMQSLSISAAGNSLHYGSQIAEHNAVRQLAGIFDVSHMGVVDITGPSATALLHFTLANNIDKLDVNNKALYSCMLNPQGGIIDDLIVYRLNTDHYRLVINAARRKTDLNWLIKINEIFDANISQWSRYYSRSRPHEITRWYNFTGESITQPKTFSLLTPKRYDHCSNRLYRWRRCRMHSTQRASWIILKHR